MHHAWQSGAEPVACEFRGEVPGELSLGLLGFNPSRQRRLNFTPQTPQTCVNLNVGKLYHFARPTSLNIFGEGSKPSSSTSRVSINQYSFNCASLYSVTRFLLTTRSWFSQLPIPASVNRALVSTHVCACVSNSASGPEHARFFVEWFSESACSG